MLTDFQGKFYVFLPALTTAPQQVKVRVQGLIESFFYAFNAVVPVKERMPEHGTASQLPFPAHPQKPRRHSRDLLELGQELTQRFIVRCEARINEPATMTAIIGTVLSGIMRHRTITRPTRHNDAHQGAACGQGDTRLGPP